MCCAIPIEEEVFDKDSIRGMEETPLPYRRLMKPSEQRLQWIRDEFPALARKFNNKPVVYFDNACSSLRPLTVLDALSSYYRNSAGCHGRVDHHFGQGVLERAGGTETRAFFEGFLQGADYLRVRMAADGWPPAADVVDVFVVVDVPGVGPFDAIENDWLASHRLERAHG